MADVFSGGSLSDTTANTAPKRAAAARVSSFFIPFYKVQSSLKITSADVNTRH